MISVMLAISHVVILSRIAHSSINTLHKIDFIHSISYEAKKTMFNRYRNTLKKTITQAKLVYYKNIFNRYKNDMKRHGALFQKHFIGVYPIL